MNVKSALSPNPFDAISPEALGCLVEWYRTVRRPLPWRANRNAYKVWISEIMLQQTRIGTVIPYYERFLSVCPDLQSLASLPEEKLMKLWEGLGYYSRARNLQKCAVLLVQNRDGKFPEDAAELAKLPGIGDYTAGAIASMAFGKPSPAVDGNVLRVVSRLTASGADVMLPETRNALREALSACYPVGEAAGLLTEGLMELGETVCLPSSPDCSACPWHKICRAKADGLTDSLPVRSGPKPKEEREILVLLLRTPDGKIAVRRRPKTGLLAGMWEFPSFETVPDEPSARNCLSSLGLAADSVSASMVRTHVFTHRVWKMKAFLCTVSEEKIPAFSPSPANGREDPLVFVSADEIASAYALPSAFRPFLSVFDGR